MNELPRLYDASEEDEVTETSPGSGLLSFFDEVLAEFEENEPTVRYVRRAS